MTYITRLDLPSQAWLCGFVPTTVIYKQLGICVVAEVDYT